MESASAATQQLQQQHNTSNKLSVPDALLQMQQAVRSGEMQQVGVLRACVAGADPATSSMHVAWQL